jgi:hypothetical protein
VVVLEKTIVVFQGERAQRSIKSAIKKRRQRESKRKKKKEMH